MTRFLISSFVDHRHLHSFPTRRSSDLLTYNKEFNHISETLNQKLDSAKKRKLVGADVHYKQFRSEEHTSELQSQSNLVCRLLLEKKKHKNTSTRPNSQLTTPTMSRLKV